MLADTAIIQRLTNIQRATVYIREDMYPQYKEYNSAVFNVVWLKGLNQRQRFFFSFLYQNPNFADDI